MTQTSRRSWFKSFGAAGAGAMLLSPTEILSAIPADNIESRVNKIAVRLSSNENPYSPSPRQLRAIADIGPDLCRYPNRHFSTLEAQIAEREGVPADQVVITSGSNEGLRAVGLIHGVRGGEILTCLPTYRAMLTYAEHFGASIRAVPLDDDLRYNLPGLADNVNNQTKLIFVCNPNNPTGTLLDPVALEKFCRDQASKAPVFVDEAYCDYIEENDYPSMKHLIAEGLDVIISRTFSKVYGLAGVRLGFLMTNSETASNIRKSLMSGPNIMGLRLAQTALEDKDFYDFSLRQNQKAKSMIYDALDEAGLKYARSHTNFVFFKTSRDISEVQSAFGDHGVKVGRAFPPYLDWCRISTGRLEEVEVFAKAVSKVF